MKQFFQSMTLIAAGANILIGIWLYTDTEWTRNDAFLVAIFFILAAIYYKDTSHD